MGEHLLIADKSDFSKNQMADLKTMNQMFEELYSPKV